MNQKRKCWTIWLAGLLVVLLAAVGCSRSNKTAQMEPQLAPSAPQTTQPEAMETVKAQTDRLIDEVHYRTEASKKTPGAYTVNGQPLYMSANPYDYTLDNEEYDKLVAMGPGALDALCVLQKNAAAYGSLDRYILAIAIEEITKIDLKYSTQFFWEDADTFADAWARFSAQAEADVQSVLQDASLTVSEKTRQICFYGILAENVTAAQLPEDAAEVLGAAQEKIASSSRTQLVAFVQAPGAPQGVSSGV